MLIKTTLSQTDLEVLALEVGVRGDFSSEVWQPRKQRYAVRGRFVPNRAVSGDRYKRVSASYFSNERRVNGLCWHGFLDVFRAIFEADSSARIETSFATWVSAADLEERAHETYFKNVGPPIQPVVFGDLCRCARQGIVA